MRVDTLIKPYSISGAKIQSGFKIVVYSTDEGSKSSYENYVITSRSNKLPEKYSSSSVDQLAHLFLSAFDNRIDVADRTTSLILKLQQFIKDQKIGLLNSFLSHNQAPKLHPSIILGALFITENINELKDSWNSLNQVFQDKMESLNESAN